MPQRICYLAILVGIILPIEVARGQEGSINFGANGYLRMLIQDPIGRRTEYDPVSRTYFSEILGSEIGSAGIDIHTDDGPEDDPHEKDPIETGIGDAANGVYTVIIFGTKLATYYVNIMAEHITTPVTNVALGGIIDSGHVVTYRFIYDYENRENTVMRKVVEPNTLLQSLAALYKPASVRLHQNYPNPFSAGGGSAFGGNPITVIPFTLPQAGFVSLKVFDILGRELSTLVNEHRPAGSHHAFFDASTLPSGVYFYKLHATGTVAIQKMILAR